MYKYHKLIILLYFTEFVIFTYEYLVLQVAMSFKSPIKLKILPGSAVRQTPPRNVSPAKKREITVDPIKEFSPYFQDLDLLLE